MLRDGLCGMMCRPECLVRCKMEIWGVMVMEFLLSLRTFRGIVV